MSVAGEVLKAFGKELGAHVLKQYPKLLEKDADEIKKHCRVCGERIHKNAEYVLSRRFRCKKCGHRTHVHCAEGDPAGKTCRACAVEPKAHAAKVGRAAKQTRRRRRAG